MHASVHRLTVVDRGNAGQFVLRQWMPGGDSWLASTRSAVVAEAAVLDSLAATDIPAPRLVATLQRSDIDAWPAILMTRAPGRLQLAPPRPDRWVREMAVVLARIHATPIAAPRWESWIDPDALSVPAWARRRDVWRAAIAAARDPGDLGDLGDGYQCFLHRDYQHFNILWRRDRLTAVVDWVHASIGPPDIDVGHCRLNLAVLFSAALAEQFREIYESEAGRKVDPRWDITALLSFHEGWHDGIQRQVAGRTTVDQSGMNDRFEDVLAAAVARL